MAEAVGLEPTQCQFESDLRYQTQRVPRGVGVQVPLLAPNIADVRKAWGFKSLHPHHTFKRVNVMTIGTGIAVAGVWISSALAIIFQPATMMILPICALGATFFIVDKS